MDEAIAAKNEEDPQKRVSRLFGRIIINHRFQLKFTFVVFGFLFTASLITWLVGYFSVGHIVKMGLLKSDQAIDTLRIMNTVIGQLSILALAITFGLAVIFSHMIAGPIYRFERVLEQIRDGNLNLFVRLRRSDEFKETAELFNQALSGLRHRIQKERDSFHATADKVRLTAERLRSLGRHEEADELDKLLTEIKSLPPQIKI